MRTTIALCLAVVASMPAAAATITTYDQRDAFLAAIANPVTEGFEDADLIDGLQLTGYQTISGGAVYTPLRSTRPPLQFDFAEAIHAFGWTSRTAGINSVTLTLGLADGTQQVLPALAESPIDIFRGLTSDVGINWVSVSSQSPAQFYVQDLTYSATVIPEPSTLASAGFGVAAILAAAAARRRRHVSTSA